jgi:hypothetical protein
VVNRIDHGVAVAPKLFDSDADATTFSFILNYGNSNLVNKDILKFNYVREELFVSRACGFLNTYLVPHTDAGSLKWIQYIAVKNSIIANENETHLEMLLLCLILSLSLSAKETSKRRTGKAKPLLKMEADSQRAQ